MSQIKLNKNSIKDSLHLNTDITELVAPKGVVRFRIYFALLQYPGLLKFNLDGKCLLNIGFYSLLEKVIWLNGYYIKARQKNIITVRKKDRVVYTAIFGGKDNLLKPKYIPSNFDLLCYTDGSIKSNIWKVIKQEPIDKDPVRSAKIFKILPHKYLNDYKYSVWADGNLRLIGNINYLVDNYLNKSSFAAFDHANLPDKRDCIYDEAKAIFAMDKNKGIRKDDPKIIKAQIDKYRSEGYPVHNGLISGMILVRKHLDSKNIKVMEDWWVEIKNHSRRDQISFNYVAWKNNFAINYIPGDSRDNKYFKHILHVK